MSSTVVLLLSVGNVDGLALADGVVFCGSAGGNPVHHFQLEFYVYFQLDCMEYAMVLL